MIRKNMRTKHSACAIALLLDVIIKAEYTSSCQKQLCLLSTGEELCYTSLRYDQPISQVTQCSEHLKNVTISLIYISNNTFETLPDHTFENMEKHFQLKIEDHRVPIRLGSKVFANITKLQTLEIINSGLEIMPDESMKGSKINNLVLKHNKLTTLPSALAPDLAGLFELDLSYNLIESIPFQIFTEMKHLVLLDLSHNKLQTVTRDWFKNLQELTILTLSHNSLKELQEGVFIDLQKVTVFELNNNEIENITESAFFMEDSHGLRGALGTKVILLKENRIHGNLFQFIENLTKKLLSLNTLNLSHNNLTGVLTLRQWRNKLMVLIDMDLSHNRVTGLTVEEENLELFNIELNLQFNNISTVRFIESNTAGASTYSSVFISENPLHCDCDLLPLLKRLRDTNLNRHVYVDPEETKCTTPKVFQDRRIKNLEPEVLSCTLPQSLCPFNCTCLVRPANTVPLELDCDRFSDSTRKGIEGLSYERIHLRLRSLPLSLNDLPSKIIVLNLTSIGLSQLPQLPNTVKVLDLTHNNMTRVPVELLTPTGPQLRLYGNVFTCHCPLDDIFHLIQNYIKVSDYQQLKCRDGNVVATVDTQVCAESEAKKQNRLVIVTVSVSVLLLLAVVTLVILFYRNRHEVFVYLYSRNWCLTCVSEQELDQDKEYDAFLTFSHADRDFVLNTLVQQLEQTYGFKLCVHYRDWVVGEMITTQIVRSVMGSRRTIVVLSHNFLNSEWAQQEFRLAHTSAMKEGLVRIIVILVDNVTHDERLSKELSAYLSTNTYIEKSDPHFWDRLLCAMPHKVPRLRAN